MNLNILVLPGDGIGPEVTREAVRVLRHVARKWNHTLRLTEGLLGGIAIHQTGNPLPEETARLAAEADATLMGAVGLPEFDNAPPEKRPEKGLLGIRKVLGVYANLRPVRAYPALLDSSPLKNERVAGTDMIIVRELTGGIYYGTPRGITENGAETRAVNTMVYTRAEIERVSRLAFQLARGRRKKVTSVDKSNVLENSQLWRRVVTEIAGGVPDVALDHMLVDNCAMQLVLNPTRFDVVLTENMFGDILSDEGAVLAGSIGMLPSASIGDRKPSGAWVGLYEPVHGSAPDIAGQNKANPLGAIGSVAAMLAYSFGLKEEAAAVEAAVEAVLESGAVTADLKPKGSPATTEQVGGAVCKAIGLTMSKPRTIVEKIWDAHTVHEQAGAPALLYIDLHLVHEVTSPQAFQGLRERGLKVRRPDLTVATADHSIPTSDRSLPIVDTIAANQLAQLEKNCGDFGIPCYGIHSEKQGIVHVIGPELGLTQPGMTVVCGDSHTATHGAFGALAFGIGTSEVEHVLATQCLLQRKSKTCRVNVEGALNAGVTAKDIILGLIAKIGVGGGTGCVLEYGGPAIRALSMEQRMTVCNMSIEGGARAGLIAPDETTFQYMAGRRHAPKGAAWDAAVERWRKLPSDDGAVYDKQVTIDADRLEPMITYGTNPGMGIPITAPVPEPSSISDPLERDSVEKALRYMGLQGGQPLLGRPVNVVFIGSCTNSRISDLRTAASLLKGRKVNPKVRVMVVPGSQDVKRQAEAEGLPEIFRAAGCEWREPGCSMCIAMNGDQLQPGEYSVSTSNRNFEGRQGKGGRTFLASPLTAAASAVTGVVTDVRTLL